MGNWLSKIPSGDDSSSRSPITGSNIQADSGPPNTTNSVNIGSGNINSGNINSGNITYNTFCIYGDTNSPENYTKIMQCLYSSGYEEHRGRVRTPVEGTCTWVTEHPKYREWFENKTSGVLWLSGDPGCGKSVIASFLITHLKAQTDATVCYFFFKDDSEEQRSASSALCAVLHQLFFQNKSLHVYAQEAFDAKGRRFTQEVETLWNILVKAVAEGGCGDVICVVDALDECEEATLTPLIRYVAGLPESQNSEIPLKLLVTGRPYHKIEMELGSPATTIRLKGEEEVNTIAADVTRVIDAGIRDLESCWGQPGGLGYLRDLLESSADRTFLWVSLVLGILKDSGDGSPEEFTNIVSTTPRDLAALYTKILDKTKYPDKARLILNIVVAAARPLTLREMNVAFRISRDGKDVRNLRDLDPGFEKTVKNYCGLFVRIIDSKVYLVHQTAREFLIKRSSLGEGNWQYTLGPNDSNFILADICITYLSREDFENVSFVISTSGDIEQGTVDHHIQKYSLLDYASRYWADHFRDSGDRQMEFFEFTRLICEAGSKRLLTWFQVYWFNSQGPYKCPYDLTHLMIASWFGQGAVVERLLDEGGDKTARCIRYGTALNIAAVRKDAGITRILLQKNVEAYISGKWYNIMQTKRSELENIIEGGEEEEVDEELAALMDQMNKFTLDLNKHFDSYEAMMDPKLKSKMVEIYMDAFSVEKDEAEYFIEEYMQKEEWEGESRDVSQEKRFMDLKAIEFLKNFCLQDTPDPRSSPNPRAISLE